MEQQKAIGGNASSMARDVLVALSKYWFLHGRNIPTEFQDPAVIPLLSYNGQLHFRCGSCSQVIWVDITFGKQLLQSGVHFPCPQCGAQKLEPITFRAVESRCCGICATQGFAHSNDPFTCSTCGSDVFIHEATIIHPPYPRQLLVLLAPNKSLGGSPESDVEFLTEYVSLLRMSPQFHQTCMHFTSFIESIFEHVYGCSEESIELLNAASGVMRMVYKETGDPDAAFGSIAYMLRGRSITSCPIQRAVYGLNICQNLYSPLARGQRKLLSLRFGFDLKVYGVALARETLAEFEGLNESWLDELRARQKWLLGDILKSDIPTEIEIEEALQWFEAALQDPALPPEVANYVRESALSAEGKRRSLSPVERSRILTSLTESTKQNVDTSTGLQRLTSLADILAGLSRSSRQRSKFALRCLGEALLYTASNDPRNVLRHEGTFISRLAAGYAAERFDAGAAVEGIAGVEAFRSLAIRHGDVQANLGHHVHDLEARLLIDALLRNENEPVSIATKMLSEHRPMMQNDLFAIFKGREDRLVLWLEVWNGELITAKIKFHSGKVDVQARKIPLGETTWATTLPMAQDPPGRLRAHRLSRALAAGWDALGSLFDDEAPTTSCLLIGPSVLGSWPIDAAEGARRIDISLPLRPLSYAPAISVAAAMQRKTEQRQIDRVLVVSYGGTDLPGTTEEISSVKAAYGSRVTLLEGNSLNRANVLAELPEKYDVVHFCGHGEFDFLEPNQSRIYFNSHEHGDSFITAADIIRCESVGRDPIFVLAACTSAAVLPNGANNFLGLAGALIRTGAAAVVGSRWPISDEVGATFSKLIHRELASGKSATAATAHAKDLLRGARIDEWSAFMSIEG